LDICEVQFITFLGAVVILVWSFCRMTAENTLSCFVPSPFAR